MNDKPHQPPSVSEASQNLPMISRLLEEYGEVILYENDKPKYKLIDMEKNPAVEMTEDEKIDFVAARIMERYRCAFEELAK